MKRSLECTTVTPNTKIWRYMNSTKILDLIQGKHLYLRRIDKFPDPYEGYISEQFKNALDQGYQELETLKVDTRREKINHLRAQALLPMYSYASCWYMDEHESERMWCSYGKEKNSIAIQTTVKNLFDSVNPGEDHYNLYFEKINYEKKPLSSNWIEVMFNKGNSYDFEQEFRMLGVMGRGIANLCYPLINNLPKINEINNPDNIYIDINVEQLIKRVYISSKADKSFKNLIESELNLMGCKYIEIIQSEF